MNVTGVVALVFDKDGAPIETVGAVLSTLNVDEVAPASVLPAASEDSPAATVMDTVPFPEHPVTLTSGVVVAASAIPETEQPVLLPLIVMSPATRAVGAIS